MNKDRSLKQSIEGGKVRNNEIYKCSIKHTPKQHYIFIKMYAHLRTYKTHGVPLAGGDEGRNQRLRGQI